MKRGKCVLGAMVLLAALAFGTRVVAGDLNPPGAPAPTMKTLDQVPPTWDKVLPSTDGDAEGCNSTRFKCVMGGAAVLDKETGLVWERSPDSTARNWFSAASFCIDHIPGDRRGWRLPTVEELASLTDAHAPHGSLSLPASHPFNNIQLGGYWSATTYHADSSMALLVDLSWSGMPMGDYKTPSTRYQWCVRGGRNIGGQ